MKTVTYDETQWVLVPREPTEAMDEAAAAAVNDATYEVYPEEIRAIWTAMLDAAAPTAGEGSKDA